MYEPSTTPFPFWGAATTSKMGRDPLAIQNSSVVIYSNMIKGITNVTGRIRYNGFYCWVLTFIAKRLFLENKTQVDNLQVQIKYLRRSELLLAYIMTDNFPLVIGVSGSIYAKISYQSSDFELDLKRGADLENKPNVYWQNSNGIFGQYYLGVLSQLRLIFLPDAKHKTYRVTEEGKNLYEIFKKSLSPQNEDLFWEAISLGKIKKKDLSLFDKLALHLINDSDELQEYTKIFCGYDSKDIEGIYIYHRLNSMKLLLTCIKSYKGTVNKQNCVLFFLEQNFCQVLKKDLQVSNEELSWFLYELNELTHTAYEAFHFAVLYSITEEPQPLINVIRTLETAFQKNKSEDNLTNDIYTYNSKLEKCYIEKEYGNLICEAAKMLCLLYSLTNTYLQQLIEHAQKEGYDIDHTGFAPLLLTRLTRSGKAKYDWAFIEDCIYSAINDHLWSSYTKSSIGQGIVHNYMIEDGLIWKLRQTDHIRTSPRLQNVLLYMEDMKWITQKEGVYEITPFGLSILDR